MVDPEKQAVEDDIGKLDCTVKLAVSQDSVDADPSAEFGGTEARRKLERKLLRKIDLRMSILILIYILNYVSWFLPTRPLAC